jgi:hypothetical protein
MSQRTGGKTAGVTEPPSAVTTHLPNQLNHLPRKSLDTYSILESGLWRQAPLLVFLPGQGTLHLS